MRGWSESWNWANVQENVDVAQVQSKQWWWPYDGSKGQTWVTLGQAWTATLNSYLKTLKHDFEFCFFEFWKLGNLKRPCAISIDMKKRNVKVFYARIGFAMDPDPSTGIKLQMNPSGGLWRSMGSDFFTRHMIWAIWFWLRWPKSVINWQEALFYDYNSCQNDQYFKTKLISSSTIGLHRL